MTSNSASLIGAPRSFMFFRLSDHSPAESGWRLMCCSSWQMRHLFSVSVEPGPGIRWSPPWANAAVDKNTPSKRRALCRNQHPDPVPAVPEVAERVPGRDRRLRVAAVVPGAREEGDVARARRFELVGEGAPGVLVGGARELRVLPGLALVGGDLDALDQAFAHPGVTAHRDR